MTSSTDELALEGGRPVRATMLPYARQSVDDADIAEVVRVLRSDWLTTGPALREFEEAFAAMVGARHAVAVSSGTAALHAAVFAAGIGPGDAVCVPALTFVASANCIRYQGGEVVFADVRQDSLCLDVTAAADALASRTRAIVTVDYAGQPSDLDELLHLCEQRGLVLIEDAAHALGGEYRRHPVGSIAHLTAFSLHPAKQMTTGEGGVVTTNDDEMAKRLRLFRNHGMDSDVHDRRARDAWYYEVVALGFNYRLTDFQAALGHSQLRKLQGWLERRRAIAGRYDEAFADMLAVERPVVLPDRRSAWHLYAIRLRLEQLRVGRAEIFSALRAENIGVNVHYIPVPWHPYYRALGYRRGSWPVAEGAYERLITLPLWPGMTDGDVEDVITGLRKVCRVFSARR